MIEVVSKQTMDEVLPLIRAYQTFYRVADIDDERNKAFFSNFGETSDFGCQFLYRKSGVAVGFATIYFTYASSITAKVGVLNDLYTLPSCRCEGFGRQILEHCRKFALSKGCARLQWVTAANNEAAQLLYDSLEATKSDWVFYTYRTDLG